MRDANKIVVMKPDGKRPFMDQGVGKGNIKVDLKSGCL
jgi:hypothetical protein